MICPNCSEEMPENTEKCPSCSVIIEETAKKGKEERKHFTHYKVILNDPGKRAKIIQVIDEIPLTTVGKIYKPTLRCEAVELKVTDLVQNELSLTNSKIFFLFFS